MCMGRMETDSRGRARRGHIRRIILETIKVGGISTVAVLAPNVVGALGRLGLVDNPRRGELVRRSIDRMYVQGLLRHGSNGLSLTPLGEKHLRMLSLKTFSKKPTKWDKRWRVLIFDIRESRRKLRDEIRRTLIGNGFVRLQQSVWVYPYDCEDWVGLWKAELQVGKELLYLIVDSVENDSMLRRKFNL